MAYGRSAVDFPQSVVHAPVVDAMFRNLLLICTLFLCLLLSFVAFSDSQPRADFTYVNPSGIHTLDPARMSWTQDFRVALNIWEGLTSWDRKTTKPIPGAAHFPPTISDNGREYTFAIRDDARWSNGDPVTAYDFIRGWRRGMEPGTAMDYAFFFTDHIEGAAEYVAWRNDVVVVLGGLRALRDGSTPTEDQLRRLANHARVRRKLTNDSIELTLPPDAASPYAWRALADDLAVLELDWGALIDSVLADHAREIDERFAKVGLAALGDQTLRVHLTRPCSYFLDLTGFPTLLPCHGSIEVLRQRYQGLPLTAEGLVVYDPQWTKPNYRRHGYDGLVTNGPYQLTDWVFKRRARLTVNPYHRAVDEISCRTVDMLEYDNVSASIMAYEAGAVDFLTDLGVPYDHELARLSRTGERPDFLRCPVLATYFFNFNCRDAEVAGRANPFVDPRVRKAFTLAVDRRSIVETVLARGDRVAYSFVPPDTIPGYQPPRGLRRNIPEAKRLLAEAGFPGGVGMAPVELLCTSNDVRVGQALARMWRQMLGVRVELRALESKTFAGTKARGEYMIARANWYADYNDPTTFLDCLTTGNGNNDSGYSSLRYDQLIASAKLLVDPTVRAKRLQEAEAVLVEQDCPILPILHYVQLIAVAPHVTGLHPNARLWFPFRYVSVNR